MKTHPRRYCCWEGSELIGLRRLQLQGDPSSEESWKADGNYTDEPAGLVTFMTAREGKGYTDAPVAETLVKKIVSASKKCD